MRILLIEFSWHAQEIIKNKEYFEKDVIVSLDPESSYILKSNQIPYYETYQFCNHKELWNKYKEITNRSIKITEILAMFLEKAFFIVRYKPTKERIEKNQLTI